MNIFFYFVLFLLMITVGMIIESFLYRIIEINGDELIFKSKYKKKKYLIDDISTLKIEVTTTSTFKVDIGLSLFHTLSLTKSNLEVLTVLITRCQYSITTVEDLNLMVKSSLLGLY